MNKVILMGRLTRDPDIRYAQSESQMAIARYTLAVDRRMRRSQDGASQDQQTADFIGCVAFGRSAEFAEKYLRQGTKIVVEGRIQGRPEGLHHGCRRRESGVCREQERIGWKWWKLFRKPQLWTAVTWRPAEQCCDR